MTSFLRDRATLASVHPHMLEALLRRHGWVETKRNELVATWKPRQEDVRADVPVDTSISDYVQRVADTLLLFGQIEHVGEAELPHRIEEVTHDTLRLRDEREDREGTSSTTLEEGRRLLTAAHAAWHDAAWRTIRSEHLADGAERHRLFMDALRMGHTERGSFVVRVMTPVPPLPEVPQTTFLEFVHAPLERRATENLIRAMSSAREAAEEAVREPKKVREIFVGATQDGVTSRLCDALAAATMQPGTLALEIRVAWASTVPIDVDPPAVRFVREVSDVLQAGAAALRERDSPLAPWIEGWIIRLHREHGTSEGDVHILTELDGQARRVSVRLTAVDYDRAATAHRDGHPVRCAGTIQRHGKRFHLDGPHDFRVLAGSERIPFDS